MSGTELPLVEGTPGLPQVPRPLLLVVNRDAALARAMEIALRREFGPQGYDAICVDSESAALALVRALRDGGRPLAVVIADQAIPGGGAPLLIETRRLFREVRTILLVAHEEMDAAIGAVNEGSLDHFFVKPLLPHEEQLLPTVSDLLGDWQRWADEDASAVRVVGRRDSEDAHALLDFLRRNDVHHRFLDLEQDEGARALLREAPDSEGLPVVILGDGTRLRRPSAAELADGLGLSTEPQRTEYDLVIVGGGPAGLAAAVYGASEGLSTLVIERHAPGGQAGQSSKIENYLGFPSGLSGSELAQRALKQSRRFEAEIVRLREAVGLERADPMRLVRLSGGGELACASLLIASGITYRRMEVPGLRELVGRGVEYGAAVADARDSEGKEVFIVGGANSAGQAALHLSEHAERVTVLVRGSSLEEGMSKYLVDRIVGSANIEVRTDTEVEGVAGEGRLEALTLRVENGDDPETVRADGLFIFIGAVPHTDWLGDLVARDTAGFVLSGRDAAVAGAVQGTEWPLDRDPFPLETSLPGVFVAGDVRRDSIKRVASACGEGAMAVQLIHRYLAEQSPSGALP
jgi:thioredoxin reductase (NADPH)